MQNLMDRPIEKKRRVNVKLLLIFIFFIITLSSISYLKFHPQLQVITNYRIAEVTQRDMVKKITTTGILDSHQKVQIKALTSGIIDKIYVKLGDKVEKGELLAKIYNPELDLRLAEAKLKLEQAKAAVNQAKYLNKLEELGGIEISALLSAFSDELKQKGIDINKFVNLKGKSGNLEYEKKIKEIKKKMYEENLKLLQQTKELAENAYESAKWYASCKNIKSPIDGIIVDISFDEGSPINEGFPLFTIVDLNKMYVKSYIDETNIPYVKPGQKVKIILGDKEISGVVNRLSPKVISSKSGGIDLGSIASSLGFGESSVSGVETIIEFEEQPDISLRPGMSVQLNIEIERHRNAKVLPRDEFLSSSNGEYVYIVKGKIAKKRKIITGLVDENYVEIVEGLNLYDKVIISSYDEFKDKEEIILKKR